MELKVIEPNEDRNNALYTSESCQLLLASYHDFYPKIGFEPPWVGYFVMRDGIGVGSCGFVGAPHDGRVEIAYWTFKEYEGEGVASFACRELLEIAQNADPTVIVTAKTAPENNASTKILTKNGFTYSEVVQDHEIGDAWLWIHQ